MATTATVQAITRVSEQVEIRVMFSDGSSKAYQLPLPLDKVSARATIQADVDHMNTLDGQVAALQSLVGVVIS